RRPLQLREAQAAAQDPDPRHRVRARRIHGAGAVDHRARDRLPARRRRRQGWYHAAHEVGAPGRGLPHELRDPPRRQLAQQRGPPPRDDGHPQLRVLRGAAALGRAEVRPRGGHRDRRARARAGADRPRPRREDRLRPDRAAEDRRADVTPDAHPGHLRMQEYVAISTGAATPPECLGDRDIEGRHGPAGRSKRLGVWGPRHRGRHGPAGASPTTGGLGTAISRGATAPPGRPERLGVWGPYRGPQPKRKGVHMRWLVPFVLAVLVLVIGAPVAAQELKTDEDKTFYAMGYALAERLSQFALTPAELELVKAGLADAVLGRERKADPRAYMAKIQELRAARAATVAAAEKKVGDAYLAKAAA